MPRKQKTFKPRPRAARGLQDMSGGELALQKHILETVARVYEQYGFDALDTPALEYADALGKFLPDDDRPNEGVFSFQDDDGQWLALRYDLTAPLARYVAQNYDRLPKPLRRYQFGPVWRNEKPGAGRWRQFLQIDADTVGAGNTAADAEICMMAADCMEQLGLARGDYVVRINNRKYLDGLLESVGLNLQDSDFERQRLTILRAMDKYERLGLDGVCALLGKGRKDESGDFTKGAGLDAAQSDAIAQVLSLSADTQSALLDAMAARVADSAIGQAGFQELREMTELFEKLGYGSDRLAIDPAIVRGLDYYTGPVFEIELNLPITDPDTGAQTRFGSVGGGGRYDDLVKRFKGLEIPATGISIGVSRLAAALAHFSDKIDTQPLAPLVVVAVMDENSRADMMQLVQKMRTAGLRAEVFTGDGGMKAQLRYADKRGARAVVIEGEDERAAGIITIKDLALGSEKSADIADNAEWRASAHAQKQVPKGELLPEIQKMLK